MLSSESFRLKMSPGNSQETLPQIVPAHFCNNFDNGNEHPLLSDDLHLNCFRISSLVPTSKDLSQSNDSIHIDGAKIDYSTTVQRSSSLRSRKSEHQNTPRIKKIVRFADTLGLDLADIRTYFDDITFFDFDLDKTYEINKESTLEQKVSVTAIPTKILIPLFQQPGGFSEFSQLVLERNVMLESAIVSDPICLSVQGIVRVRNLSYNKSVFVRYTMNSWRTMSDLKCLYLSNSCDGFTDQFSFVIYAHCLEPGQRLEFAICFQSENGHYWDNNRTNNYIFQCLPSSPNSHYSSIITNEDKWNGGSFY